MDKQFHNFREMSLVKASFTDKGTANEETNITSVLLAV
jgi:hypothetical protein